MRFRYRHTDGLYKKMLNSEFLEVSIFCICRFLHDETGECHATVWRMPRKMSCPTAPRTKKSYHNKTKRKTATTIGKKQFFLLYLWLVSNKIIINE